MNNINGGKTMNSVSRYHNTSVTNRTLYPAIPYSNRVISDGGVISDNGAMVGLYENMLSLLPYTDLLVCPDAGIKTRTSGIYSYVAKAYDMGIAGLDATQTTEVNQPYLSGNIAPNERKAFKNNGSKGLDISEINKLSTDKWSICLVFNWDGSQSSTQELFGKLGQSSFRIKNSTYYEFRFISKDGVISYSDEYNKSIVIKKTNIIHLIADGTGALQMWLNGVIIKSFSSITNATSLSINKLFIGNSSDTTYCFNGLIGYFQVLNKNLSKAQVESQYNYLRSQYPEIEGVNIGNQHWATSNYEGVVTGNGTVIPEVQSASTSTNPELMIGGDFESGLIGSIDTGGDGVSTYILNTTNPISGTQDGRIQVTSIGNQQARPIFQYYKSTLIRNKAYTLSFDYKVNSGTCVIYGWGINITAINLTISGSGTLSTTQICNTDMGAYFRIYLNNKNLFDLQIDNISIKETGWADLTTPAWCYYNNDPVLGSVYGKLYNYYAVQEIAKNPPKGWRVPSSADFVQLSTYLGGDTVSGGKLKKEGTTYWNSPNTGATNESGFSVIPSGWRQVDGSFTSLNYVSTSYTLNGYRTYLQHNASIFSSMDLLTGNFGRTIRLLRTSPVGDQTQIVKVDKFTTNIASGTANKDVSIPFGYEVRAINVKSAQALTNLQCVMYNYGGGTSQATLFTGKSVAAGAEIKFSVNVDCPVQYQDPVLRFNATGNGGDGMEINIVLNKIL